MEKLESKCFGFIAKARGLINSNVELGKRFLHQAFRIYNENILAFRGGIVERELNIVSGAYLLQSMVTEKGFRLQTRRVNYIH